MARSVIIIDPLTTNRIRLAALLGRAQYEVSTAPSIAEASGSNLEADLIILSTGVAPLGERIARALCSLTGGRAVPLICLDDDAGPMRRLHALRAGARELLPRNSPEALLLALFRGLIRDTETARELARRRAMTRSFQLAEPRQDFLLAERVCCVSSSGDTAARLAAGLPDQDIETIVPAQILRQDPDADLHIVSVGRDAALLETLLPELRDRSQSRHAPLLVLYPPDLPELAVTGLNLGASEVAFDTATGEELAVRVSRMLERKRLRDHLRRAMEESYRLATTDALTGLYNRRYSEVYMTDVLTRASDTGRGFVVMMLDIDHFKAVNDKHGHPVGDQVLCAVADRISANLRAIDLVARYGGEEFLVVLPETGAEEAEQAAQRLRGLIGGQPVALEDGSEISVTASIGVAICGGERDMARARTGTFDLPDDIGGAAVAPLLSAADAALYRAKNNGRDRVELSPGA